MDDDEKECRMLLSKNIKYYRSRLGFSQLDLALELEISTTFLSDIETGRKWVSAKTLSQIARALKIEVFELFKPETKTVPEAGDADKQNEVIKYLDSVDDSLARHIIHAIRPAIERSITKSVAKMRRHYETGISNP